MGCLGRKTGEPYADDPDRYPETDHFHVVAQKKSNARRQVVVSNEVDFFEDFETKYADVLPSDSVTYGNEWDLYSASMAETSARVRRAVEQLRSAEAMAVLVSLHDPTFLEGRQEARDAACNGLGLFWEHNWTADGPIARNTRAEWQQKIAAQIDRYVETLFSDAVSRLSSLIPAENDQQRFFVFNPLSWVRTDAVDLDFSGSEDVHVHDLVSGEDVPHQFATESGRRFLRVLTSDLPPVGYRVYEIRAGRGNKEYGAAAIVSAQNRTIENAQLKLSVDADGAIASLIDKQHGNRELAASIAGLKLNDFAPGEGPGKAVVVENAGPVSVTLRCESEAVPSHITRVTLYRDSSRVDLSNEIVQNFGDVRHWTFSFNLALPDVHCEEVGAIIRVKRRSEGGHYADRNARYQYATLNHFCDISSDEGERGVTLSNRDCAFVRLGNSTPSSLDTATPQLHVLAGGQVDGDRLGIRDQHGAKYFLQRFALQPHTGYDPVAAMKFALEHQNSPLARFVTGRSNAPLPANQLSLLQISDPGVLLWSLKPAEDGIGKGVIARIWNVTDSPIDTIITWHHGMAAAHRTTHIETDIKPVTLQSGALSTTMARQQLQTFRFRPDVSNGAAAP